MGLREQTPSKAMRQFLLFLLCLLVEATVGLEEMEALGVDVQVVREEETEIAAFLELEAVQEKRVGRHKIPHNLNDPKLGDVEYSQNELIGVQGDPNIVEDPSSRLEDGDQKRVGRFRLRTGESYQGYGNHHGQHNENQQQLRTQDHHENQQDSREHFAHHRAIDQGYGNQLGDPTKSGDLYTEHRVTSDTNSIQEERKFELIASLAQQDGAEEENKDGRRCINKVMLVEQIEYDEVLTCDHSYDNRCHTSYVTKYEPHQEEDCEERFKKTCYIDYEQKAYTEKVEVCTTPWVKDCEVQESGGSQVCQTIYQSECFTKQTVHQVEDDVAQCETIQEEKCEEVQEGFTTELKCDTWPREVCTLEKQQVKKYTPDTYCQKVPKEMCAPRGCGIVEGPVECQDKVKTVVVDNPVEECDMEPIRTCKHMTKLVPRLVPTEECVDVPKEICARSKINPRTIKKPAIQKWCFPPENLPVDGGWSQWSSSAPCSQTCGGGTRPRTRTCSNPAPANGGSACIGDSSDSESCNTEACPGDC